jgi:acylphosphatase
LVERSVRDRKATGSSPAAPTIEKMPNKSVVHGIISGKVQGIGYRWFVESTAKTLGINGWVRNLSNGDVEIQAEGEKEALQKFLDSLKTGHSGATVKEIKTNWPNTKQNSLTGFRIRF